MRKFSLIFFVFFISSNLLSYSQNLNFSDFLNLQKMTESEVKSYLDKKTGWILTSEEIDSSFYDFKIETWAYNYNSYTKKADSWLYACYKDGYENTIKYQTQESIFNDIITEVKSDNTHWVFDKITDDVDGYKSTVYKFKKYKIAFLNGTYKYIILDNYIEFEKLQSIELAKELEKQKLALEKELEKKRQDSLLLVEKQLKDEKYKKSIAKADSLYNLKKFISAKIIYKEAQDIKPLEAYPNTKLKEILAILDFLEQRKTKIYDYKEYNSLDFNNISNSLTSDIKEYMSSTSESGQLKIDLVYKIDTIGIKSFEYSSVLNTNTIILNSILEIAKNYSLSEIYKNNYTLNSSATFSFDINLDNKIYNVKSDNVEILIKADDEIYKSEIEKLIADNPIGKYQISIQSKKLNNIDYSNNKIIKYKGIGGPSSIFLSLLVPGLGDKPVSGGSKQGIYTSLWSYGFIVTGVSSEFVSRYFYNKYHNTTLQTDINSYYDYANYSHKASLALNAIGLAIWVYDIFWVANTGFKNSKIQKAYKNKLGLSYNSNLNYYELTYKIKI